MSRDEAKQLREKSWLGPLIENDVARISELLTQSSDALEQTALLMAAGRGGALTLRSQVEQFLSPEYKPMVVEEALTTLCTWWSLEVEYRDFILAAIKGFPWDIDREVQGRGLVIAVDLLAKQPDREVLQAVLDVPNLMTKWTMRTSSPSPTLKTRSFGACPTSSTRAGVSYRRWSASASPGGGGRRGHCSCPADAHRADAGCGGGVQPGVTLRAR